MLHTSCSRSRILLAISVALIGIAWSGFVEAAGLEDELAAIKSELKEMRDSYKEKLNSQDKRIVELEKRLEAEREENRAKLDEIKQSIDEMALAGDNRTSQTTASTFNPSIGVVVDTVGVASNEHDAAGVNNRFNLRSVELDLQANIDPFANGVVVVSGSDHGVEVEEAYVRTLTLPHNLSVKAGKFLVDFGRLSPTHEHELPFVDQAPVIQNYFGGSLMGTGIEVDYLFPAEHFLRGTLGMYNKAEGHTHFNTVPQPSELFSDPVNNRNLDDFSFLARLHTFFELSESQSLGVGMSGLVHDPNLKKRTLGLDVSYEWRPLETAEYRGLNWNTEFFYNDEEFANVKRFWYWEPFDVDRDAYGLTTSLEYQLSKKWFTGLRCDFYEDAFSGKENRVYSTALTYKPSHFQKIRLQYSLHDHDTPDMWERPNVNQEFRHVDHDFSRVYLQWEWIIGSHSHDMR
ncbi:hypothetical protein ACFL1X_11720 [Candidatus Hydrogenedentota bacterium]